MTSDSCWERETVLYTGVIPVGGPLSSAGSTPKLCLGSTDELSRFSERGKQSGWVGGEAVGNLRAAGGGE